MFLPSLLSVLALTALASSVSAESGCRCGDAAYLSIPRVILSTAEQLKPCASHKLIDARGSGEPQGVSLMFQVAIQRILANNTGAVSQSVIYPAGFNQNVTSGVQHAVNIIKHGLQDCPNQRFYFLGYSQGATVVQEALEKLDVESEAAINGVVLVGNPYRIPGRLSNVDGYGRLDNRTQYGMFAVRPIHSNESFSSYSQSLDGSGKVRDICLENDIVCSSDPACPCQLASDHMSYGLMEGVQELIFDHITSRF